MLSSGFKVLKAINCWLLFKLMYLHSRHGNRRNNTVTVFLDLRSIAMRFSNTAERNDAISSNVGCLEARFS